jgi:hypothetical protein
MSTGNLTQGIKIFLKAKYVENKSIGLLDNATTATSDIRLIEQEMAGTSELYMHGVLSVEGIGERAWSSDLTRGGAVATIESVSVEWDNTAQFFKTIQNLNITIHGCKAHIIEFSKNVSTGVVTETIVYRGIAKVTQWNEIDYSVVVESDDRDANISTLIDSTNYPDATDDLIGNPIPVTFGTIDKALLTRTADRITKYAGAAIKATIYNPTDAIVFPVLVAGVAPTLQYQIKLGNGWCGGGMAMSVVGKYLYVVEGGSADDDNYAGEYRKIESSSTSATVLTVNLEAPFPKTLVADVNARGTNQAWVSIVDLPKQYDLDVWKCKDFLDSTGAATSTLLDVYGYSDTKTIELGVVDALGDLNNKKYIVREYAEKFTLLPNTSFTPNANKNRLTVESIRFVDNDPDNIDYYTILPVENTALNAISTLTDWDTSISSDFYKFKKGGNGFYYDPKSGTPSEPHVADFINESTISQTGSIANLTDLDGDTSLLLSMVAPYKPIGTFRACWSLLFDYPSLPDGYEWDNAYFILKCQNLLVWTDTLLPATQIWTDSYLRVLNRKFVGYAKQQSDDTYWKKLNHYYTMNNLPSFYAANTGYSNDTNFYCDNPVSDPLNNNTYGITNMVLSLNSLDVYNSNYRACVNFYNEWNITSTFEVTFTWKIYIHELAVCFRKKNNIKKNVFSYTSGRVRDSLWRAGKAATDLLESPGDVIEHCCRLENWQDETATAYNWGKAYCAEALIKTSGAGSFDDTELAFTNTFQIARQILDYDTAWVGAIKQSICQQFGLGQYRNAEGYECLSYIIDKNSVTPTDTITLADIPEGMEPGEVQEPRAEDVYCYNLQFKYNYNYGSGKYDGLISINNTQAAVYDPAYVTGYNGGLKEALWDCSHQQFIKYGNVKEPPAEMVELSWVRSETLAGWLALYVLAWQGKRRIQVPVVYSKVKTWDIFKHILINFPHQTDGNNFECVIEKIKHDAHKNISILDLVVYGSTEYSFSSSSSSSISTSIEGPLYVQETIEAVSSAYMIQESTDETDPDKQEVI